MINKSTRERLRYMLFCVFHRSSYEHAAYLKKHNVFKAIGESCRFQPYLIPRDAKNIILHNNVGIGTGVLLICHDAVHKVLNNKYDENGRKITTNSSLKRRANDIEIFDNVQIGANAIICPGVRIGPNAIISTGSVVTKDVPPDSIVAGNPAVVIGSFSVMEKLRRGEEAGNQESDSFVRDSAKENTGDEKELEKRVLSILSKNINGVDFEREKAIIDDGLIDSLSLISIVTLLEQQFNCKIPYQRINAATFNSVSGIARMLSEIGGEVPSDEEKADPTHTAKIGQPLALDSKDTEKPVVMRIFENAKAVPAKPAVIANDKVTSYQEIADMILSVSDWLRDKGIKSGDRVIVQAVHRDTCIACYYAIHLLGAVLVPVEKTATKQRILEIAGDTGAKLIISLKKEEADIPWFTYQEVESKSHTAAYHPDMDISFPSIDLPCEMIFTTGTTGKSKGVLITHRNMAWYVYAVAKAVEMKEDNRFLLTTPLNHAGGLRRTHLMLANACCIVYLDGMSDLERYFSYIRKYEVTSLYLPPVTIRILLTRAGDELAKFKDQIDFVYSSSSPLPAGDCDSLRELLPETRLYNAYEASETPGVSANDYNKGVHDNNCLGKANEGTELGIQLESGEIVKDADVQGRVCVKGRMNMLEYDREPTLTASVKCGDWFVSSDLGHLDKEGNLYYEGREGDVINIGGYKIAPTDIEEVALMSGQCKECICIEAFDEYSIPYIKLLTVPISEEKYDARLLADYLAQRLEAYKLPRKIEKTDAVSRTFNGKIDRKAYRK